MESLILVLIIGVVFGFICRSMAEKRGRNEAIGFLWGFFFAIWAVIGYLIAGDTSKKRADLVAEAMGKYKEEKRSELINQDNEKEL